MEQYKIGCGIVRIHGKTEQNKLREATAKFLKKAETQRKKEVKKIEARQETHGCTA